jgi:hypothetical protein
MSTPPDQDIQTVVNELKRGGWVMGVFAMAGVLARLILTGVKYNHWIWFRKIVAGGIVGVISYFAMFNSGIDLMLQSVICSVAGAMAPELFEVVHNKIMEKLTKNG